MAGSSWPREDLEAVPECPVCGQPCRELWLDGLRDDIFRVAAGRWTLWRCADCRSAYLDPRPTRPSIGRAYTGYYTHDEGAAKHFIVPGDRPDLAWKRALHCSYYNHRYGHRLDGALPLGWLAVASAHRRRVRAGHYIRHLPPPAAAGARLLDVGCGSGVFLRVAAALGYRAQGLEFDAAAAGAAVAAGCEVTVGAIDAVDFDGGAFEQVTLNHVIEHLHDPVDSLRRLRGWMRPGARLWIQTPNVASRGAERYGAQWRGLEPPRHLVMFDADSLRLALERAGFERVELLPPQLDAAFYIEQSESLRAGRDPYAAPRSERRRARRLGCAWDRDALAGPRRAESLTMVAFNQTTPEAA